MMRKNLVVRELVEWVKAIGFAFILALIINIFIFEVYTVDGFSMVPTLQHGDRVVALKVNHLFNTVPDYGEIVIVDGNVSRLRSIKDEFVDNALVSKLLGRVNQYIWIKRVIGKPGDIIEVKDGKLYRNEEIIKEDYINEKMVRDFNQITVPKGHVFVMGDNRNHSKDSRYVGAIPLENVRAEVWFRFLPLKKLGTLK